MKNKTKQKTTEVKGLSRHGELSISTGGIKNMNEKC